MSGLLSNITFGSYTFPASFRIASVTHDTNIEEVKPIGLDGTHITPGLSNSAVIRIEAQMGVGEYSNTTGLPLNTYQDFQNEAQAIYSVLASGYQLVTAGYSLGAATKPVQIYAQKTKYSVTFDNGFGRKTGKIAIELVAQDPRWLAVTASTQTNSGNVINTGLANTYPIFTIGACNDPQIQLTCPGGYIQITLQVSVGSASPLIINCDPRQRANAVTSAGTSLLYALGTNGIVNTSGNAAAFPYLAPGTWAVTFTSCGFNPQMSWQDAWPVA